MHARVLVELAALLASNGEVLMRASRPLSGSCLADYWSASKCRVDRWTRAIKGAENRGTGGPHGLNHWPDDPGFRPWLEEIITGETLTRVWTAVVCGVEKSRPVKEAEPVVRSVLFGHLEVRRRMLRLLVSGRGVGTRQAVALNRLRRQTERWTDMLLGYLLPVHDVRDLAFDPSRAMDFADGLRSERHQPWGVHAWPLVLSSLRAAFCTAMDSCSPNNDLNLRIASSILACFGPDLFDSIGQFQSLWQARLTYVTSDTLGMVEQLLAERSTSEDQRHWPPGATPATPGHTEPDRGAQTVMRAVLSGFTTGATCRSPPGLTILQSVPRTSLDGGLCAGACRRPHLSGG